MCLARVQFVSEEGARPSDAIEDVALIEITPEGMKVTDLLGSVKNLEGEIRSIDFMESLVCIKSPKSPTGG